MTKVFDTIIVGSGAAGLSAALYGGRYLMKILVVNGSFGGETAIAGTIWNYPGVPGADGFDLMTKMKEQAKEVGTEFVDGKVTEITNDASCYRVMVGDQEFFSKSIIFANGAERKRLGLPNEQELTNKGVHFCVTCDGPLYMGKKVAVVGGGDASVKGVNLLAQYAEKIYLLVRGKSMRAEPINIEEMKKHSDKVEILYETEVKEIVGEKKLDKIILSKPHEGLIDFVIDGLFVEIGAKPDIEVATSLGVELDSLGYIKVGNLMETNVPGIYAAGDAVNFFGQFKQTVTAAAMGAVAVTSVYNYHKIHGNLCEVHFRPSPMEATSLINPT